jgi:predicted CXXCH cytochrome family protein
MKECNKCHVLLTPETWSNYLEKSKRNICLKCHKEYMKEQSKKYRKRHPEKIRSGWEKWHENHKEEAKASAKRWRINNKEWIKKYSREYGRKWYRNNYQKIRSEVLKHYGDKCACCGEKDMRFGTLDRINNDGNKQRKELEKQSKGIWFYYWLKRNNYPDVYKLQVLCWNCNLAKAIYGECPHKGDNV